MNTIEMTDENIAEISGKEHSEKEFEYLVTSHQAEVRVEVAKNPHLPIRFANWMSQDVRQDVRATLAANPILSKEIFEVLIAESSMAVLAGLASNPNVPIEYLIKLGEHKSYLVRDPVAGNPSAPKHLLETLSKDGVWGVRRSVAGNPSASVEVLKKLASDEVNEVLFALTKNQAATPEVFEQLLKSASKSESEVKNLKIAILENPSYPENLAMDAYNQAMKKTDEDDDDLMNGSDVRIAVSQRPNLSEKAIDVIILDPYYIVRGYLARNLSVSDRYLSRLALDSEQSVRTDVIGNPNASDETKASAILLGVDQDDE